MPNTITEYRIFIASPGGLDKDRNAFHKVISEYNSADAYYRKLRFTPIGWEETLGGFGRPQSHINEDVKSSDYLILLLHDRWGSKPYHEEIDSKYTSGTEEEFYVALDAYNNYEMPMKQIIVFFKAVGERQLSDPGDELKKVLLFRKQLEDSKNLLYHTYDSCEKFESILRKYLAKWSYDHKDGTRRKTDKITFSSNGMKDQNGNWLHPVFDVNRNIEDLESLMSYAEELAQNNNFVEAELVFSNISVISENPGDFIRYGNFLKGSGHLHRAKDMHTKAYNMASEVGDINLQALAIFSLADTNAMMGNLDEAEKGFLRVLNLYREDTLGRGNALRELGEINRKQGKLDEATDCLLESKNIFEEINDELGLAYTLSRLGLIYKNQGNFKDAEYTQKKALQIFIKHKKDNQIAITRSNLGVVYRTQGRISKAIDLHRKALQIFKDINDKQGMAREYSNLGTAYRINNDLTAAIKMHEKSLDLSEQLNNKRGVAIQYSNIGRIKRIENKLFEAEEMVDRSREISERIGDRHGLAIQYENLGLIYFASKEWIRSKAALKKAYELNKLLKSKFGMAKCSKALGEVSMKTDKIDDALNWLSESQRLFKEMSLNHELEGINRLINGTRKKFPTIC